MEVLSHLLVEQKACWTHPVCSVFSMLTPVPRVLTVSRSQPSPASLQVGTSRVWESNTLMLKPLPSQLLEAGLGAPETKLVAIQQSAAGAAPCCGVVSRWKASRDGSPVPRKA